jgi:orotidine-5'-phosphate decarboxylase
MLKIINVQIDSLECIARALDDAHHDMMYLLRRVRAGNTIDEGDIADGLCAMEDASAAIRDMIISGRAIRIYNPCSRD